MSLPPVPLAQNITLTGGTFSAPWRVWLTRLFQLAQVIGTQGTTAQRPIGTNTVPLYIGQWYFDQTLGYPVWVKSLNPTVWVNGAGSVV